MTETVTSESIASKDRPIEEIAASVRHVLPALSALLDSAADTFGNSENYRPFVDDLWRLLFVTEAATEALCLKGMKGLDATNMIYDEGYALSSLRDADIKRLRSKSGAQQ